MQALVYHCPSLTDLDVSRCLAITDVGIEAVATRLAPQMRALALSGCSGITTRSAGLAAQ